MDRSSSFPAIRTSRLPSAAVCALFAVAGCADSQPLTYCETVRVDETIPEAEFRLLAGVLKSLTPAQREALPEVFASAPSWSEERTPPVRVLVAEEVRRQSDEASLEIVARRFPRSRAFERLVASGRRTPEQIVAIYIAAAWALARAEIEDERALDEFARRAEPEVERLRLDDRPYGPLPGEVRFGIEQRAAWLAVTDRVERLRFVPPENVTTVLGLGPEFAELFPPGCRRDPVTAVLPRLELFGVPFEEPDPSRSDAVLTWDAETALVGAG